MKGKSRFQKVNELLENILSYKYDIQYKGIFYVT